MPSLRRSFVSAVVPVDAWHSLQVAVDVFGSTRTRESMWYQSMTHRSRRGNGTRSLRRKWLDGKGYIPTAPSGSYAQPAMLQARMQEPRNRGIHGVLLPPTGTRDDPLAFPRGGLDGPLCGTVVVHEDAASSGLSPLPQGEPMNACAQPLGHLLVDGVYIHRDDRSYCPVLNDIPHDEDDIPEEEYEE